MKQRSTVFSFVPILGFFVILALCTGCVSLVAPGGRVVLPSDSSVVLLASTEMSAAGYLCYTSEGLFSAQRYKGGKWITIHYDDTLGISSKSFFWFGEGEKHQAFFRCGQYLLFLTEYRGNDSLKLIARRFDMMGKPVGQPKILLAMEEKTDNESTNKSPFYISLSPDSSCFAAVNYSYRIINNTENFTFTRETDMLTSVFDEELATKQNRVHSVVEVGAIVTMGVDNEGGMYMVQHQTLGELVLQRYLPGKEGIAIYLPIIGDTTVKHQVQSIVIPSPDKREWNVFSVISTPNLEKTVSFLIHSCDWNTGKAHRATNYLLDKNVAESVVNDGTMSNMLLNDVIVTQHGFVFWLESTKKGVVEEINASGRRRVEPMQELGPICLFSFAKDGAFMWQKGIIRNLRLYQNVFASQRCSHVSVVRDNLHIAYGNTNQSRRITYDMGHTFITVDAIASSTGEIVRHNDVLNFDGAAFWTRRDIGWSTSNSLLIPCYEYSTGYVNILKLQTKN